MAEFSKLIITKNGQKLLAKMIAGTNNVEFTKISTSSTTYTITQLEGLTALSNVQQTSQPARITRTNDVAIKVETSFSNAELKTGYYMRALGLYNYTSSQAFIMPTVRRGSANATAKAANKMLQWLLGLPVDGIFGANTEAAVRAAQKAHGLTVDGVVGPKTWKALAGVQ